MPIDLVNNVDVLPDAPLILSETNVQLLEVNAQQTTLLMPKLTMTTLLDDESK
jgi:hypothetical protein